jgi:hypothetical protein
LCYSIAHPVLEFLLARLVLILYKVLQVSRHGESLSFSAAERFTLDPECSAAVETYLRPQALGEPAVLNKEKKNLPTANIRNARLEFSIP